MVIHTQDLRVLLLERADHPGWWQSVTGSLEGGETPRETAIREVAEETGLNADAYLLDDWRQRNVYEIFACYRHRYAPDTTHNTEHVFALTLPEVQPVTLAANEHLAWQWLPWQTAAELCFSVSNAEAIRQLPSRARSGKK